MTIGKPLRYRTLFLSDVHLGSPHSQVERLLTFLNATHFDLLCLVGDIFDDPGIDLPDRHNAILDLILERLRIGVRVIFIPGNHDKVYRDIRGDYGGLTVLPRYVHITVRGITILVTHGDEWDWFVSWSWLHRLDQWFAQPFWELLRKYMQGFMRRHVEAFAGRALNGRLGQDKVLCGHVHSPALRGDYLNCGDWVTHCSAIAEHFDGTLELIHG